MANAYDPYVPDFGAIENRPKDDLPEYLALADRLLQLLDNVEEAILDQYDNITRHSAWPSWADMRLFYTLLRTLEMTRAGVFDRLVDLVPLIVGELLKEIQAVGGVVPPSEPAYDFDKWVADLKARSGPDRQSLGTDVWTALDVLADGFKEPGEGED
jgi:hypothetical protein